MTILKNRFIGINQIQESLDVFDTTLQHDGEEVIWQCLQACLLQTFLCIGSHSFVRRPC